MAQLLANQLGDLRSEVTKEVRATPCVRRVLSPCCASAQRVAPYATRFEPYVALPCAQACMAFAAVSQECGASRHFPMLVLEVSEGCRLHPEAARPQASAHSLTLVFQLAFTGSSRPFLSTAHLP